MEPITTITYLLTTFFGYYVGADMWNQIKCRLDRISSSLNRMDSKLN